MPRPVTLPIRSPRQWDAIASPVRFELLETFRALAPCPIRDVAKRLGVPADRLYRHAEVLVEAGFLTRHGVRKSGRHTEQIFGVAMDDLAVDFSGQPRAGVAETYRATGHAFLRLTRKAIDSAADARAIELGEGRSTAVAFAGYARLTDSDFRRVHELLRQVKAIVDASRRETEGELYLTTLFACPVPASARPLARGAASDTRTRSATKRRRKTPESGS